MVKPRILYVPIVTITNFIYELLYYYTVIINIIVNGFDFHYYDYYYYYYIGNDVCLFYIAVKSFVTDNLIDTNYNIYYLVHCT